MSKIEDISIEKYLENITTSLRDVIHALKKSTKWKINLKIKINFKSSKVSNKKHLMHSKSDNKEIMTGFDTGELLEKLLNRFCIGQS